MPVARDPRSYIKRKPVPVPIDRGAKIEARSAGCYKTSIGSVHDWREEKYKRREVQLTTQGYNAAPNIPYKGIGEPFYLDEQQLILHALGQWDGRDDLDTSSSSDEDEYDFTVDSQKYQTTSATSIVLKRSKKEMNTLQKEVLHGSSMMESSLQSSRNMIRNVSLGHGLFDLIKQEQHAKQEAENLQNQRRVEKMRTEWQPPKVESSSDEETDNEIGEDVELSRYMQTIGPESGGEEEVPSDNAESPEPKGDEDGTLTAFTTPRPTTGFSPSPRSLTVTSGKRKKPKAPRPYTPLHNNIMDAKENVDKDALFRQLCALHWLLEAMAVHNRTGGDNSIQMTPITSSWKLAPKEDIGGAKIFPRDMEGMTWNDLLNLRISQKGPGKRRSRLGTMRHTQVGPKSKGLLHPSYPHGLQSNLRVSSSLDNSIDESLPATSRGGDHRGEEEEEGRYQSIFKYLNEDFAAKLKEDYEERQESATTTHRERKKERRKTDSEHSPKKSPRKSADLHKSTDSERTRSANLRDSARSTRADSMIIRPKSSPQLMQFQNNRASLKYNNIVNEMNQKFQERKEDAAVQLHEQLEQLERQRLAVCQNKFIAINSQSKGSSFHRAVQEMRERSNKMFSKPLSAQAKKKEQEGVKGNWLLELMSTIPQDMINGVWYYKVILNKLHNKYGMIEGSGQQHSKRTFFKVLERLREWEICSPDICAAIEFCREKIVEVPVEDFEEWFTSQFPKILRPQTAPAGKDKKSREGKREPYYYHSAYAERSKSGYSVRSTRTALSGLSSIGYSGRKLSTAATLANPGAVVRPLTTSTARKGPSDLTVARPKSMR